MNLPSTFTAQHRQLASGGLTEIELLHHAVLPGWVVELDLDGSAAEAIVWNPAAGDHKTPEPFSGEGSTLAEAWREAIFAAVRRSPRH